MYTQNNGVNGTFATEVWPAGVTGNIIYETNRVKVVFTTGPLPVELTNFEVTQEDQNTLLSWTTASEKNNAGFEIQKSKDGGDWQKIGFVEGNGTTDELSKYHYRDSNPFPGINYYRLKQIDFDGESSFSDVEAIEFSRIKDQVNIYPNPSTSNVNIQLDNPLKQIMEITLYDNLGQEFWKSGIIEGESSWNKSFEIDKKGTYFISVMIGKELYVDRIIILEE